MIRVLRMAGDEEGARRDAQLARGLGFCGKATISLRGTVDIINEVFTRLRRKSVQLTRFLRPSGRQQAGKRTVFPAEK